jgi:hypothetical protein
MERLSDIVARVEKLEPLVARDEGYVLQAWRAQRAAQGAVQSPVLFTAFAGPSAAARPLTAGAAWCPVRKDARRCGLPTVKPHDFRRFVGTELAKRDLRQAQKAWGTSAGRRPCSTTCWIPCSQGSPRTYFKREGERWALQLPLTPLDRRSPGSC